MNMMERTRFLGRTAVLAATCATLLAAGTAGVAEAAPTSTASAAHVTHFVLPAGQDSIKVSTGGATVTVTRPAGASPDYSIGCGLYITDPAYYSGSVQSTATLRCEYWTSFFLENDLSYNGSTIASAGQQFSGYVASETVTTSAVPGYYQSVAVAVTNDGVQYGNVYSNDVYISQ